MLAAVVLAVALLIPGPLFAQESAAKSNASAQPCSDYEKSFPLAVSRSSTERSKTLYQQSTKLAGKKKFDLALEKVKRRERFLLWTRCYASAQKANRGKASRRGAAQGKSGDADRRCNRRAGSLRQA